MPQNRPIQHFQNGVLIGQTPFTVQDDELRRDAALTRLITGRAQLRAIRNTAQNAADSNAVLTLVQLTSQFRQLAGAVAILSQTIMDIELIAAHQEDDGQA